MLTGGTTMTTEFSDEPLNLTVKKMPIAIVAPFSRTEPNDKVAVTTALEEDKGVAPPDAPQDLSVKPKSERDRPYSGHGLLDLSKNVNTFHNIKNLIDPSEQLRNYLLKGDSKTAAATTTTATATAIGRNSRNVYSPSNNNDDNDEKSHRYRDVDERRSIEERAATMTAPDLYSLIDNKFLAAWYMNSLRAHHHLQQQQQQQQQQHPYLNLAANVDAADKGGNGASTSPKSNRILNNLLEKKPYRTYAFPSGFDALIKNETQTDEDVKSPSTVTCANTIPINTATTTISSGSQDHKNNGDGKNNQDNEKKKPHIKKPLNAFMLYMKEMRAKVVAECTLKESAAINQILGRRWHSLSREEQGKYYEQARLERQVHMQKYPGWSARDNYGYGTKKKKRKKERAPIESGGNSMKKCRARYGLDQQSQWCKPCRRKKKCIRYMESGESNDGNRSDDNLGSCGSMGDANTPPDDDNESLSQSISSPGALSGLSSLTSPGGLVLASPSTSVASPSVSAASPYMLQSPLTPHDGYDVKMPLVAAPPAVLHPRNAPIGANPHDVNNPLSVNQLTRQCVRGGNGDAASHETNGNKDASAPRSIISVT